VKPFLTPRDLALAVGASESSLKRWVDEGSIIASRTTGGHRRIALAEAVRFIRESRLHVVRPALLGLDELPLVPAGEPPATETLTAAMCSGAGHEIHALLVSAFLGGASIAALCDGPIRSALATVGELWRHGPGGIALEHQAVDACSQALATMRQTLPELRADAPTALGGAIGGDPYLLPSLGASIVLHEVGYRAINLGPDLPCEALLHGIDRHRPAVVWRSASIASDARDVRRELEALEPALATARAELVVGGRGLASTSVPRGERVHAFSSMAELAGFARGLFASRVPAAT
jgi:MerR family transcriptional regulator, light-induced transcriptional regulator